MPWLLLLDLSFYMTTLRSPTEGTVQSETGGPGQLFLDLQMTKCVFQVKLVKSNYTYLEFFARCLSYLFCVLNVLMPFTSRAQKGTKSSDVCLAKFEKDPIKKKQQKRISPTALMLEGCPGYQQSPGRMFYHLWPLPQLSEKGFAFFP